MGSLRGCKRGLILSWAGRPLEGFPIRAASGSASVERFINRGTDPRAVIFWFRQGIALLKRGHRLTGEFLISRRSPRLPFNFGVSHATNYLCWRTFHDHSGWNVEARRYKREGSHECLVTKDTVHYDCSHTDERIATDVTAVKNCSMPDMSVGKDDAFFAREAVEDAVVLNIRAIMNCNLAKVAAKRGAWTDVAASSDYDISDQRRGRVNKTPWPDHRYERLIRIAGQCLVPLVARLAAGRTGGMLLRGDMESSTGTEPSAELHAT